jgi:hypothetical protein
VILYAATLFLVLVSTQPIRLSLVINYLIYFAILPVLTILIILRKNPLDYGLRIGNYKLWGLYIALTVIVGIPILYVGAHFSSISHYYTRRFDYYSFLTQMVPLLFAWEYLLRGFLLFEIKVDFI